MQQRAQALLVELGRQQTTLQGLGQQGVVLAQQIQQNQIQPLAEILGNIQRLEGEIQLLLAPQARQRTVLQAELAELNRQLDVGVPQVEAQNRNRLAEITRLQQAQAVAQPQPLQFAAAPAQPVQPQLDIRQIANTVSRNLRTQEQIVDDLPGDHRATIQQIDRVRQDITRAFRAAYPIGNEVAPTSLAAEQNLQRVVTNAFTYSQQLGQQIQQILAQPQPVPMFQPVAVPGAAVPNLAGFVDPRAGVVAPDDAPAEDVPADPGAAPVGPVAHAPRAQAYDLLQAASYNLRETHEQFIRGLLTSPYAANIRTDEHGLAVASLIPAGQQFNREIEAYNKRANMLNKLRDVILAEEAVAAANNQAVEARNNLLECERRNSNSNVSLTRKELGVTGIILGITALATMHGSGEMDLGKTLENLVTLNFSDEFMWLAIAAMLLKSIQIAVELGKGSSLASKFSTEARDLERAQEVEMQKLQQSLEELNRKQAILQEAFHQAGLDQTGPVFGHMRQQISDIQDGIAQCKFNITNVRSDQKSKKEGDTQLKAAFLVVTVAAVLLASGAVDDLESAAIALASIALAGILAYGAKSFLSPAEQAPQQAEQVAQFRV